MDELPLSRSTLDHLRVFAGLEHGGEVDDGVFQCPEGRLRRLSLGQNKRYSSENCRFVHVFWIGVVDERELRKVLSIPEDVQARMAMMLGYPDESPGSRRRKPIEEVVSHEKYS